MKFFKPTSGSISVLALFGFLPIVTATFSYLVGRLFTESPNAGIHIYGGFFEMLEIALIQVPAILIVFSLLANRLFRTREESIFPRYVYYCFSSIVISSLSGLLASITLVWYLSLSDTVGSFLFITLVHFFMTYFASGLMLVTAILAGFITTGILQ